VSSLEPTVMVFLASGDTSGEWEHGQRRGRTGWDSLCQVDNGSDVPRGPNLRWLLLSVAGAAGHLIVTAVPVHASRHLVESPVLLFIRCGDAAVVQSLGARWHLLGLLCAPRVSLDGPAMWVRG
jgi:hypothetical protein